MRLPNALPIEKNRFLVDEIWLLTFHGGLGRSGVYAKTAKEQHKIEFRSHVRDWLDERIATDYSNSPQQHEKHCAVLQELKSTIDGRYSDLFAIREIPLGIVQKIANLNLKYRWCQEWIPTPPHFPIDRIILSRIPQFSNLNWTTLNCLQTYRDIINAAQKEADPVSIAEWELLTFSRRNAPR